MPYHIPHMTIFSALNRIDGGRLSTCNSTGQRLILFDLNNGTLSVNMLKARLFFVLKNSLSVVELHYESKHQRGDLSPL